MSTATVRVILRNDVAATWTSSNPTLSLGEYGLETDTGAYKVGDGSTAWTSLAYTLTPYGYSLINDANAGAARTTLAVYSSAEVDALTWTESDITDLDKYTTAEVDALTWTESDITDLDKYTQAEVDALRGPSQT